MKPDFGSRKWFSRIARRLFRSGGGGVADGPVNGNTEDLPVTAFIRIFLTHAALDGSDQTVFAEMDRILVPGVDDDVLHDIVQLYR